MALMAAILDAAAQDMNGMGLYNKLVIDHS